MDTRWEKLGGSGFVRGLEGARALAAALAELPLQELQLNLAENRIGPGPGEERPGASELSPDSLALFCCSEGCG